MTTCELCGCTKDHVRRIYDDGFHFIDRCYPSCEPENEVSE